MVVVDDGSSDETAAIARRHGAQVLRHPFNLGYGAALQTGYKYARRHSARLVVQMDADGQHDPRDVETLVAPVLRGVLDVVIGSRFLGADGYRIGLARLAGRSLFQGLARLRGLRITDPTSGFQALGPTALDLYVGDFFPTDHPDVDVLLTAHRCGLRIGERSVAMGAGLRDSLLHRRLTPVYYVYKMLLAIWAASASRRRSPSGSGELK